MVHLGMALPGRGSRTATRALYWGGRLHSSASAAGSGGKKAPPRIEYNLRPFRELDVPSLMNSYLVYRLCRSEKLIDNASTILERMQSMGLSEVCNKFIKATFYKHFCGGETSEELKVVQTNLKNRKIGSILDYACEAEYDESKPFCVDSAVTSAKEFSGKIISTIDWCVYGYKPMIVAKVTSLLSPKFLIGWSNTLNLLQSEFERLAGGPGKGNGKIDLAAFLKLSSVFPGFSAQRELAEKAFKTADKDNDNLIDYIDLIPVFSMHNPEMFPLLMGCTPPNPEKYIGNFLDSQLVQSAGLSLPYSRELFEKVMSRNLLIAIDAEQTYFHPAIDDFAIGFSRIYKYSDKPFVYNTYQMYLKNTEKKMLEYYESAKRLKIPFGFKIVRGAYIVTERERALKCKYEDPAQPTYEDTSNNYNKNVARFIHEAAKKSRDAPIGMLIASHNADSVSMALAAINDTGVEDLNISFAQLYGMKDPLTEFLSTTPFTSYKYIPHGPVEITIPYLLRRAIENKGVLSNTPHKKGRKPVKTEEDLILEEITHRIPGRSIIPGSQLYK